MYIGKASGTYIRYLTGRYDGVKGREGEMKVIYIYREGGRNLNDLEGRKKMGRKKGDEGGETGVIGWKEGKGGVEGRRDGGTADIWEGGRVSRRRDEECRSRVPRAILNWRREGGRRCTVLG